MKELDITQTGPMGYKDLQAQNNSQYDDIDNFINESRSRILSAARQSNPYRDAPQLVQSSLSNTNTAWGESLFDNNTANQADFEHLGDVRATNQPWYAKIGAGLAKGVVLAGTTFLDGTVGLVLGAGQAIAEGRFSALWDNDFSKAMQSVNEWSEQALPNYYTDAERNEPWYENIFTANFLGDKFIKNLGFTVGAFYSGGVTAAGLKATKLPQIIGAIAKSSRAPAIVTSGVGATISAVNEGRIEALNNSTDWFNLQKAKLDDKHNARLEFLEDQYAGTEMYNQLVMQENANYEATIGKLTEDRLKMGNSDLLMNIPILTASNLIQFGRMYANGFKTARKATNIVGKVGESATGKTIGKGIVRATLSPLSEGTEEISQKAASVVSGLAYEQDVNNFYKSKINPEAEQQTIDWIKAFAQGINETVNDGSSWEEFFIGTLTGALGMPRFRGIRSSEGRLQSPITLEGGVLGEFREYRDKMNRENEIVNYMNERVQSPEFRNYYQGLIRHNKYQNDMNQAVENNDEFEFKNAEHAQLISDIAMFDNAGKLEDLTTLINSAYDTSDENLASIVENTTSTVTDENGKEAKVGPFIDKNGNPMYSTPEGKQKMIDKLTQTRDEILNTITNYTKIKDDIDVRTGQQLSDEQLEELTWLKSQIGNWQDRANQLSSEVKPTIGTILGSMSQLANMYNSIKTKEGKAHAGLTDLYNSADKNERQIRKNMSILETIRGLDDKTFAYLLSSDPKLVEGVKSVIESPFSGVDADDIQTIHNKIDDIVKLVNATGKYNTKLKEYLENPAKLQKDIVSSTENIAKEEAKKKSDNLKSRLISATNLSEFREALNNEEDATTREETLKSLEDEGNEMAKNYKEVNAYNTDVQRAINSLDESSTVKADALKLLQDQFENSSNLDEIANPNSIYIDNADALYDDNLTLEENAVKFQEAQYALLRAMNQINNENRFKDRFSKEYRELRIKGKSNPSAPEKDTTGDSGTSTIPSVSTEGLPVVTYEPPVGNVTATQVKDENRETNSSVETPQSLDNNQRGRRPYYRPSIPELHIQASKEGDFRPFNVVAAEREKGVNFDELYDYLRDNGAFTYVNEGNLKAGDELGFMIDPALEEQMKSYEWYKGPTILLIDKRNNQVVGSLDESQYSVDRYEGLKGLEEKIRKEYAEREAVSQLGILYGKQSITTALNNHKNRVLNHGVAYGITGSKVKSISDGTISFDGLSEDKTTVKLTKEEQREAARILNSNLSRAEQSESIQELFDKVADRVLNEISNNDFSSIEQSKFKETSSPQSKGKFIATPTTRVSKVMVGRIPYGTEERSLANIPNVLSEGKKPIFGIIKNGKLDTNKDADIKINYDDIIKPAKMDQKEGRMYLLIPNAAGKYSPAAVRVKHFNKTEFNPKDVEVQSTQVYKNIQESIDALANSLSEDDLNNAVKSLSTNLYTGDLHIDWFTSNTGNGIRFTKVQRDVQGNEIYEEKGGKRVRKETVKTVFLKRWDQNTRFSITGSDEVQTELTPKSIEDVSKEISEILLDFNLPIQVNLGMLNRGGYNNILINSNVLTSNISDARVISSWFTTDYFDVEGNLHKAVNPASVTPDTTRGSSPVGGTEGVITGTKVVVGGVTYGVDLTTGVIYGSNNQRVYPKNAQLISDLAWASANFGDATNGSFIWNNKILLPSGQVLDRATQKYLTGKEAQEVKDKIAGRERTIGDSKKVIAQIDENQKKVDKTRTDGEFYYILEEDGQYHEYERVHSRLGSNWVESKKQTDALKNIRVRLSQLADNVTQYNDYLKYLSNYWKVNLDAFSGKIDARSRDTIVNTIRDSMSGTNSQVDSVVRNFFTSNDTPVKPDNMSEKAFTDLIASLTEIKSNIEARGERFLTNNIVLFQKYADGTRIAGEVDILSVDADGNFRIYDVETNKYSFYDFTDKYGNRVNYFLNPSATQRMSAKDYYTLQLSAYKNLFESQYHTPITTLAVMPFVLNYNKDIIDGVTKEKGIMITYNPSVNVPLVGAVKVSEPASTNSSIPIFNSALEIQDPINRILPENDFAKNSIVGYYDKDGKLYKGYLKHIGTIEGVDIYLTKERDRGFGKEGELNESSSYYVVLPNGKLIDTKTLSTSDDKAASVIMEALQDKPQKVKDLASEKTLIFDPTSAPKIEAPKVETTATILSTPTESGAAKTAQAEQAVTENDDEFEDDLDLSSFRRADNETRSTWNQEKELAWIKKVLPQLSDNDRVRVVKGLIRVANSGAYAWGQFNNGIITLSDISAEGTTYHEAFHAVFNLLLDQNERISLLNEYREKHPNMDNLSLEEELAEDFREFVMQGGKDTRSLGRKIIDFFKSLFIKTKYWKDFRPSSIYYFRAINEGKYSGENIPITVVSDSRYKQEKYTQEMQDILAKAPRDAEGNLLAPNGKKSNLTERQYAQVRTTAFKKWFGDWEKVARSSKFRESTNIPNSITSATYQGVTVSEALFDPDMAPDGGKRIIFLGDKYIGEIPIFETKDKIIMGGSIGAATEIEEEYRGKGYGKKAHLALANIAKSEGKILYSDSSNSDSEDALWKSLVRDGIAEIISERPKVGHWNHTTYRILNDKLPQADDINSGDRNVSKVVDENGEPLVVYTGVPIKGLIEFSLNTPNRASLTSTLKKGIYFSDKNTAKLYKKGNPVYKTTDKVNAEQAKKIDTLYWAGESYDIFEEYVGLPLNIIKEYIEQFTNEYTGELDNYSIPEGEVIAAFLNIKNPVKIQHNGTSIINLLKEDKIKINNSEGAIINDVDEHTTDSFINTHSTDYIVFNSNQIKSATDNIGTFDANNPDIRYRKVPSIAELRAQEKSAYDRFNNDIEEYYREARDIIKEVNYRRFNTEREAMKAFNESGIRKDFFYRITREGANNAAGYKIQLLTRDMVEQYKQDNNPYSDEYKDYTTPIENFYFDSLDPEIQMMLLDKGWTKEQFDSISQQERDQAVKCIAL